MNHKRNIVFLTGTRADFGKLKSLMLATKNSDNYELHIFATGMHLNAKYGKTIDEIYKSGFSSVFPYMNHSTVEDMDRTLAKTVDGFSRYISEISPDLIVVHGDRVEALAGAIVGSLNNIRVAHIEGGEVSGTVDELIRHAVSKLSHFHLVSNQEAKTRLIQLGEYKENIFEIGSPDIDLMNPSTLPDIQEVKQYYDIPFQRYSVAMFHPVTTEYDNMRNYAEQFVSALIESEKNYIVIYPNSDLGSSEILTEYKRLQQDPHFKVFPSLRFEYFLALLFHSEFIIGNSSAGIREAPYYRVPTIDIGTRQLNRAQLKSIVHADYDKASIKEQIRAIESIENHELSSTGSNFFGRGNSDRLFLEILDSGLLWKLGCQKQFQEAHYD